LNLSNSVTLRSEQEIEKEKKNKKKIMHGPRIPFYKTTSGKDSAMFCTNPRSGLKKIVRSAICVQLSSSGLAALA
jgi:hypothetical protein